MKAAYMFLSSKRNGWKDRVNMPGTDMWMIGVKDLAQACEVAKALQEEGYKQIELCGGFREEGCRAVMEATGNTMSINYAIHLPENDEAYKKLFSK